MSKWEYLVVVANQDKVVEVNGKAADGYKVTLSRGLQGQNIFEFINHLGQEGWELAGLSGNVALMAYGFKRPLP